ncbi:MAG: UbiD family decarboxylase [Bacteroidetes bacterium]|nr:UbiD family decarboxylase [Bacteroidota bacterium]
MVYTTLHDCILDLEKKGDLIRIKEEVDPHLEMASIHLRIHEAKGKAILFEKIKECSYPAVSNLFGTLDRSKFIFRNHFSDIKKLIDIKNNPASFFKNAKSLSLLKSAYCSLPKKINAPVSRYFKEINIDQLPLIKHWPLDGGAFITLPQVYSEDVERQGIKHSNLGMYRIQLSGNQYELNKEVGLHYQLHRGIGVHQTNANKKNIPLKVSVFVGGPPSHTLAAVMPLPEGMSELNFAGALGGRRFRYTYHEGYCISLDADFVITGEVYPNENKPEGPFGDHLGYYSLTHLFPVMRIHKVFAKKEKAIWPFTVVGRPPQEDTAFGNLIHELSGNALANEIHGLKSLHAVDAAGVHPLLLAVGSERYTPYIAEKKPSEILTIANKILGTGQLSLAKYLFITADEQTTVATQKQLSAHNIEAFLIHCLERLDFSRDIHFYTKTSIDTLDYSGTDLNSGSKVVLAAYGKPIRKLCTAVPAFLKNKKTRLVMPGVIAMQESCFTSYQEAKEEIKKICAQLEEEKREDIALVVLCDDEGFVAQNLNNFLWVTFTRSNPSHDIYGVNAGTDHKHWTCEAPLIIDARKKPHHAPELEKDVFIEKRTDAILSNII